MGQAVQKQTLLYILLVVIQKCHNPMEEEFSNTQ